MESYSDLSFVCAIFTGLIERLINCMFDLVQITIPNLQFVLFDDKCANSPINRKKNSSHRCRRCRRYRRRSINIKCVCYWNRKFCRVSYAHCVRSVRQKMKANESERRIINWIKM